MARKELLVVPKRKLDEVFHNVFGVYIIPSRRKHDSGYNCMDFVATTPKGMVGFGGGCDDVRFCGSHFRMDCCNGIIHIWNSRQNAGKPMTFSVSSDVSSVDFFGD